MKTIILAAGHGYKLGGFNKLLLRNPRDGKTIMDSLLEIFSDTQITVVVGFNATTIMKEYPQLNYVFNRDWHITKDGYSFALSGCDEPCYIVHADMFFSKELRFALDKCDENAVLTSNNDSRGQMSLNCRVDNEEIKQIYVGELINQNDSEIIGIYKLLDQNTVDDLRINCLKNPTLSLGENYPISSKNSLISIPSEALDLSKIKTPFDYIQFLNRCNNHNEI